MSTVRKTPSVFYIRSKCRDQKIERMSLYLDEIIRLSAEPNTPTSRLYNHSEECEGPRSGRRIDEGEDGKI